MIGMFSSLISRAQGGKQNEMEEKNAFEISANDEEEEVIVE